MRCSLLGVHAQCLCICRSVWGGRLSTDVVVSLLLLYTDPVDARGSRSLPGSRGLCRPLRQHRYSTRRVRRRVWRELMLARCYLVNSRPIRRIILMRIRNARMLCLSVRPSQSGIVSKRLNMPIVVIFSRPYLRSCLCYSVVRVCRLSSVRNVLWLNGTS